MSALKIARGLELPVDLVGESTAILAKKGAGKSNTAKVIVEETLDHGGVQVIVLDPIGHWWSLRAGGDGKAKDGYPVAVFGGMHGDLPLEATAGKLLAQTAVESGQSMILDVSSLDSDGAMQRFAYEFAEELYKLKQATPTPVLLVLEEADEFAPQDTRGANVPRMVGAFNRIVKRGRGRGIGTLVVTQRSAALSKNVLDQSDTLIVMRTIGPRDRAAIEGWIKHQQAAGADDVLPSLPSLETGEAWIWTPERNLLKRVKVRKARTFDSSQTPRPGEAAVVADVKPIDVDALGAAIKATAERVKASDPKELQKRIRELERDLAARPTEVEEKLVVETVEVPAVSDGQITRLERVAKELADVAASTAEFAREILAETARIVGTRTKEARGDGEPRAERATRQDRERPLRPAERARRAGVLEDRPLADGDTQLKAGARRIVETLARHYPMRVTRAQLGTLTGFKITGGTFQTYFSQLKRLGLIVEDSREISITEAGLEFAGVVAQEPMTTDEMLDMWRGALKAGARAMLDVLVEFYDAPLTKDELAERVGMTPTGGTFQTYLSTLRRNGLVDVVGGEVRASDTLFIGSSTV